MHADAGQQPPATRIGAWPTFDVAHRPANFGSTFATSGEGSTHSDQQPAMSVDRPTTNHDPAADDVWLEQGQEVVHETRPSDTPLQEGAQDPRLLIAMLASGAALQGDAHTHARRAMSDGVATNPLSTQRLHGANAPQPPPAPPGATAVADNRIAAALQPSAGLTHSAVRGSEAQEAMQSSSGGARSHAQVLQTQSSTVVLAHGADVVQAGVARAAPVAEPQVATPARMTLAQALGERLHVQIGQRSEHASIRLDPPSMGSIEVVVRHEAGSIQVHLRASNADVARQLQGMGEALRQDLSQRQQGEVAVHVWDASRDGEGRRREQREAAFWREQAPGRALDDLSGDVSKAFALAQE
ncbi:MAG TPA: flagellar hook-length control protein FliK [Steroidobacter sp.]|nr:flagellar hook-length control protein FliK [Steroidobacteraceae bacterium]HLS81606.1 flagellar hook-length control protein FliK [Steroidobacter sp.]